MEAEVQGLVVALVAHMVQACFPFKPQMYFHGRVESFWAESGRMSRSQQAKGGGRVIEAEKEQLLRLGQESTGHSKNQKTCCLAGVSSSRDGGEGASEMR